MRGALAINLLAALRGKGRPVTTAAAWGEAVISSPAVVKKRMPVAAMLVSCLVAGCVLAASPAAAASGDGCGFFFCEPEAWLSNQNAVHLISGYALQVTAAELNDSPWNNFLWLSIAGLGIETFQGAVLEHPLHGGFSYKNVIFNEIGLLAGVAAYELFFDGNRREYVAGGSPSLGGYTPAAYAPLPMARYLRPCPCGRRKEFPSFSSTAVSSPGAAVAGLLKPGVQARFARAAAVSPSGQGE